MAQVSENRKEPHDAVMQDDIIREKAILLRRKECGFRDVENSLTKPKLCEWVFVSINFQLP